MNKVYRVLLVGICFFGILFGLQYIPAVAKYVHIPGVPTAIDLPSMPTFIYQTVEPLTVLTNQTATVEPETTQEPAIATATPTVLVTTQVAGNTNTVSQPCNNILYPVKVGQGWSYQVSARGRTTQINMVVSAVGGQQGQIDVTSRASGIASRAIVDCDNGVIRNFPSMFNDLLFNNASNGTMNMQYVSGVLAPGQSAFEQNNWGLAWSGEYRISGSISVPFQGETYSMELNNSPTTLSCQTLATGSAAFETITIAAGTFPQALRVACTGKSQVTSTINGHTIVGTMIANSTQWFAPNIGLLKMQVDSVSLAAVGLSIPVNINGQVELTGFQPAP